jgi:hypothetical protein
MTTKLLLASLPLFISSIAGADPDSQHRIAPRAPIYEIDVVATQTHAKITSTLVWPNGAWTLEDFRTKTPTTKSGRLDAAQRKQLVDDLSRATWKKNYVAVRCMAPPVISTEYHAFGALVWTEPTCGEILDAESRDVLARADALVLGATGQAPVACTPTGTPLVELAERERTWTVYRDGAWTLDLHTPGQTPSRQSKCLDKVVIAKIEADVAQATWTISHPVHCMARSVDRTVVKVNGQVVFTERMCNPDALDDASAQRLADIEQLMGFAQPPGCLPTPDAPLVELDYKDSRAHAPQRTVTVWESGAWLVEETVDGSSTKHATGCLAAAERKAIVDDVAAAPWQVTLHDITCHALSSSSTIVKIRGKLVVERRLCGADALDNESAKRLAAIEKLVASL